MVTAMAASIACTVITILAQFSGDNRITPGILALSSSGAAMALSLVVISRQKVKGLFPKLYAALGIALSFWFAAESIWVYYEVGASMMTPFPSVADALWLAGYAPYCYFLFGILKNFLGISRSLVFPIVPIGAIGFVLVGNILFSIYQHSDLASDNGVMSFLIASAYPLVDMLVMIPALAVFIQLRKGLLTFTPWLMIVIASVAMTVADIGFAYSVLLSQMKEYVWIWNPIYNVAYIAIATSLFWHKSFFTINEKKQLRQWQESNR